MIHELQVIDENPVYGGKLDSFFMFHFRIWGLNKNSISGKNKHIKAFP
ncbi:hypothetical protein A33Q_1285 [Indibacter alkaliphilus LW1]|uniref:Uncharacterized protein n=1 Tax=Indibacter alkaliphilus (strain CCUG 57479 / KCTC 22604 / LW1) TaxID=1189612 RepID=S2E2E1_INDAL|nr:hypothetical protein A33Q_1285 [Indibacter alkaliphilus LW1]